MFENKKLVETLTEQHYLVFKPLIDLILVFEDLN